jgi:hypothetical protein
MDIHFDIAMFLEQLGCQWLRQVPFSHECLVRDYDFPDYLTDQFLGPTSITNRQQHDRFFFFLIRPIGLVYVVQVIGGSCICSIYFYTKLYQENIGSNLFCLLISAMIASLVDVKWTQKYIQFCFLFHNVDF